MEEEKYQIELLNGKILRVRIPSKPFNGHRLPDAVFTFREGDPQYEMWSQRYKEQSGFGSTSREQAN
ncbi:MAG: hypothetical protein Q4G68_04675 [Planctomycetia bacterium]|nr:hypothetical protein [Planctomycetia bacterium]